MSPETIFAMGAAALEAGDFLAAEQLFHQIVNANPRAHPVWNALSVVAVRAGLPEVAAEHAQRALALDRRNPLYLNNLGVAYGELGDFTKAEEAFRRALKAKPAYAEAMFNLGKVLHKRADLPGSLRAYERAYAMDAEFPGLRTDLSLLHRKHGRSDLALAVLRAAPGGGERDEELAPAIAECMADVEGAEAALDWLRAMVQRHPGSAATRATLGHLALSLGIWREGWSGYLWRANVASDRPGGPPPALPARCDGKRVLLRGEQGLGDVLFFLRFAPLLRFRGALLALACEPKLAAVMAADGRLSEVRASGDDGARFDLEVLLGDLPGLLMTEEVPKAWALAAAESDLARARAQLAQLGPGPYLGVTWRAGTDVLRSQEFGKDRRVLMKELPLVELGAALRGWRGTLVALQRSPVPGELAAVAGACEAVLHDLSTLNDDLPRMLAMLAVLDDYVCVSNTNVHLLAGIGRTARVLVPYPPEWRWMREGASPWFPGFALYREPQSRGWAEPLSRLRKDLIG